MLDRVIFEDKRLLVLNKPTGVAVHGGSGISHGVIELLRHARPDLKDLSLVHRIDRETSGCLVMAKRRSALRELHERFREGRVEKNYLALVVGDWQLGEQLIDAPLHVHHRQSGERHVVVSSKLGKPAQTRVSLSRTYGSYSLMLCAPITGRTHQIRVHLDHAEHPIAGDERYGDDDANRKARKFGLKRLFLHAQSIAFPDKSGNELHFTAPLAEDLEQFLSVGIRKCRRQESALQEQRVVRAISLGRAGSPVAAVGRQPRSSAGRSGPSGRRSSQTRTGQTRALEFEAASAIVGLIVVQVGISQAAVELSETNGRNVRMLIPCSADRVENANGGEKCHRFARRRQQLLDGFLMIRLACQAPGRPVRRADLHQ